MSRSPWIGSYSPVDEVAEILDKTGLTKEEKEQVTRIENRLSTIARQGRAFGIHLFLSTQRPDANILSGQIKNNIGYRICRPRRQRYCP